MTPDETAEKPKTAMKRGIFLAKCYGIIYLIMIVSFALHSYNSSIDVPIAELKGGDRFFGDETFIASSGERLEYSAGSQLEPEMVALVHKIAMEGKEKLIPIHKVGFYYNLPWVTIYGIWNFLGLVLLLYTVAGDALPRALDSHSEAINRELEAAREAMRESEELIRNYKELLLELKQERVRLKLKTDEEASAEHNHIITQTKADVERMELALERHLEAQIQSAIDKMRREISAEIIQKVRADISEGVEEQTHHNIIADFTAEIKGMNLP